MCSFLTLFHSFNEKAKKTLRSVFSTIGVFIKREPVLCAALLLAVVAICFVRPQPSVLVHAVDFRVLSLLLCLMAVIQAFRSVGVLDAIAAFLLKQCTSVRSLYFVLTFLVFFSSMAVTNDVALLTFVPLTLIICRKASLNAVFLIVVETLAANLGSCVTPMGNPQNLFLYSFYNMTAADFFKATLSIGLPSAILLVATILIKTKRPSKKVDATDTTSATSFIAKDDVSGVSGAGKLNVALEPVHIESAFRVIVYSLLLVVILFSVFRVLDYRISLVVTVVVLAVCNFRLFSKVDYSLLVTFVGFFLFTGTISGVPAVSAFLQKMLGTPLSTYFAGIISSQVISNVPAALLLSGFTDNARQLLLAVNVGGLGTIIASLASVISYKLYNADRLSDKKLEQHDLPIQQHEQHDQKFEPQDSKKVPSYMVVFTLYNLVFLAILGVVVWFLAGR